MPLARDARGLLRAVAVREVRLPVAGGALLARESAAVRPTLDELIMDPALVAL